MAKWLVRAGKVLHSSHFTYFIAHPSHLVLTQPHSPSNSPIIESRLLLISHLLAPVRILCVLMVLRIQARGKAESIWQAKNAHLALRLGVLAPATQPHCSSLVHMPTDSLLPTFLSTNRLYVLSERTYRNKKLNPLYLLFRDYRQSSALPSKTWTKYSGRTWPKKLL